MRSTWASMSAETLATIDPTVRQATRMSWTMVVFDDLVASHATVSSKSLAWPTLWRA